MAASLLPALSQAGLSLRLVSTIVLRLVFTVLAIKFVPKRVNISKLDNRMGCQARNPDYGSINLHAIKSESSRGSLRLQFLQICDVTRSAYIPEVHSSDFSLGASCAESPACVHAAAMALLKGSCHCGSVKFSVMSHTPSPYQSCYCEPMPLPLPRAQTP